MLRSDIRKLMKQEKENEKEKKEKISNQTQWFSEFVEKEIN